MFCVCYTVDFISISQAVTDIWNSDAMKVDFKPLNLLVEVFKPLPILHDVTVGTWMSSCVG